MDSGRYAVEVWGWKDRERLERLQERYLKWVLGVEGRTPDYMVREELQREKLKSKAGRRAWGYKERLMEGRGGRLAQRCMLEMRERAARGDGLLG